ncbi:MAG: OPT family oligopeptide transporter [bacterium]
MAQTLEKKLTPEEIELEWYRTVYRGDDMPQFTLRAVIMGSFLGAFMSLSNLYIGLKTGWGLGVAITSCILSFAIWKTLRKVLPRLFRSDMSILENNAMQSTASSAGYSTGGTMVSAISAYLLLNGQHIGYGVLTIWIFFLAVLGVTMAIPMKRQMINVEGLKFPSGVAAAETLKSLHGDGKEGKSEGMGAARALFAAGGIGVVIATIRDGFGWLPSLYNTFGARLSHYTVAFEASLLLVAAGAIMGLRVAVSIMIGGIINWGFLAPPMIQKGVITHPAPTLRSAEKLTFPMSVPAGHALKLTLIKASEGPFFSTGADTTRLSYTWHQRATYASMESLIGGLNDSLLNDGRTRNSLFGRVAFAEPEAAYEKGHLEARASSASSWEAALSLPDTSLAPIAVGGTAATFMGFNQWSGMRLTAAPRFPLTIPAGERLSLSIDEAERPILYAYLWPSDKIYPTAKDLIKDLGAPKGLWGQPNALSGVFRFDASKDSVFITAPSAATLLAFEPGAADHQVPGGFRNIVSWSLWGGAACMVSSGLLTFAFEWRTVLRAFSGLGRIFRRRKGPGMIDDPLERVEVPGTWFAGGMVVGTVGVVAVVAVYFGVAVWMALLAIVLSFFLALVACRATGETDTTPVGAMGKITQLTYGVLAPKQMNTNLMTACITAGVADSAADLLTDLKSGYCLGANARQQFLAQFSGIFVGTAVVVPAFYLIVPNVAVLGSDKFPAPAAQVWASVARLLVNGFESLHPTARLALLIGGLVGILIPIAERLFPKARPYIPSAMGLGLAFCIPFWNCLSMFIGGLIAFTFEKVRPALAEKFTIPIASGLIAGESLMGIFITLGLTLGWI